MNWSTRQLTRFEIYWQEKGAMRAEAIPYLMKKPEMEHMSRLRTCAPVNLGQSTTQTSTEMRWAGWNGDAAPPIPCPFAIEQ
jgi:hypothetical protein